jgi:hypothetical protein
MRAGLLAVFTLILMIACKGDSKTKTDNSTATNAGKKIDLKAFPADQITTINKECTSIDLISLRKDLNVSMSFDNPQAIAIILSFITDETGNLTNLCLPDAHLVFQKNGEVIQDLDLYYQNTCNAMVFLDKSNKQIGANKISNEGIDFFNNFLKNKTSQDTAGRSHQ